jgi:hypothetical protein
LKAGILLAILLLILPVSVVSAQPILSIGNITGGIGVKSVIKNVGSATATNVEWNITFTGGTIWYPTNRITTGTIASLVAAESVPIKSFVLGFGNNIIVTVSVKADAPALPVSKQTPPGPTHIILFLIW